MVYADAKYVGEIVKEGTNKNGERYIVILTDSGSYKTIHPDRKA